MRPIALIIYALSCSLQLVAQSRQGKPLAEPGFFSFDYFNFWTLLSLITAVAAFVYSYRKLASFKSSFRSYQKQISTTLSNRDTPANQVQTHSAIKDFRILEDQIIEQNSSIQRMQQQLDALAITGSDRSNALHEELPINFSASVQERNTFYMVHPSYEYFPAAAKATKDKSLYKFTLLDGGTEARFEILNDGLPLEGVVNYRTTYIDKACDAQNQPPLAVKSIRTITPGRVRLESEKWYIQDKAIIAYE